MKNAIEYFYNLRPNEIRQNKNEYLFEIDNIHYSFKECNRSLEEIRELYILTNELYYKNIYLHHIIPNLNKDLVTLVNNKNYILMRLFVLDNRKVRIEDILKFNEHKIVGDYNFITRNNWRKLWIDKIDYVEYQMNENKSRCKIFNSSIDFMIGLVENGIQLLYGIEIKNLYVSHDRINVNTRVKDLYDPLNIVLDSKVRDISEYVKDTLPEKIDLNYILSFRFEEDNMYLFFVRLLLFTKYFDIIDIYLRNEKNDNDIELVVNQLKDYESLLRKIYLILHSKYILPEIEWLKKQAI